MSGAAANLRNQKDSLAIEIGDNYLNIAYIKASGKARKVVDTFSSPIKEPTGDEVVTKIRAFVKSQRVKSPGVINVIPSQYAISKNIEIPSTDKKEIKEIIYLQAGRHTPYSSSEIIMDYTETGTLHNRYTKILLIIVKRDVVTTRYDTILKAGFVADTAVLASEAVSRLCYGVCPEKTKGLPIGVVHIDKVRIDFTVVNKGGIIYIRPIPVGILPGQNKSAEERQGFLAELKKSLDSYQAENIETMPAKLYFTGVTDLISGMEKDIEKELGIAIEIMPPSRIFGPSAGLGEEKFEYQQVSLLATIAPGISSEDVAINLVPDDVKVKKELKKRAMEVMMIGAFSMLLMVIFCATLVANMFFKEFYLSKLKSSYTKENEEAKSLKEVSDRTLMVKRFAKQKGDSLYVLTEFYGAMPHEVYINSINFKTDNTLVFTGTADSMSRVFTLVKDLEDHKLFKGVKVDFTKTRRAKDQELADFGITMNIEEAAINAKNN